MRFNFNFYKTTLFIAVEKGNLEIVRLLLNQPELKVNEKSIFSIKF